MEGINGILVIGEIANGKLSPVSREALACARKLAIQSKSDVGIVILVSSLD
mgnify:CR=1 FL=1